MKTKTFVFTAVLAFALGTAAYAAELTWTGCGITKKAFMAELAKAYEARTGTKVTISGGGATKGIRATLNGESDIGGSCRNKLEGEEEKEALMHLVGWDALVVVVHKDNPLENLTKTQVYDIFKGKITDWKELGGAAGPLNLYTRESEISGVGFALRQLVFDDVNEDFTSKTIQMKSSGPLEKAIGDDVGGIGVTGVSSAKKRSDLKMLKVNGVSPSKENVIAAKYAYFRPLYLVTKGEPVGEIGRFIDFALSPEGQRVISEQGTVNLDEGRELESIAEIEGLLL